MHRFSARLLAGLNDFLDHQIGLVGGCGAYMDRLIGHFDVQRVFIGVGIDRHRRNTHAFGSFDDAAGDFAAIGDEDFFEHFRSRLKSRFGLTKRKKETGKLDLMTTP